MKSPSSFCRPQRGTALALSDPCAPILAIREVVTGPRGFTQRRLWHDVQAGALAHAPPILAVDERDCAAEEALPLVDCPSEPLTQAASATAPHLGSRKPSGSPELVEQRLRFL
jgi:hypothetical protein